MSPANVPPSTDDARNALLAQLRDLVPSAFPDGELDRDALLDALDLGESERPAFTFRWPGLEQARLDARRPTTATLAPDPDASVDFEVANDVLIEGDNLQVLKLLKNGYSRSVKLIYIDPPFPRKWGCCGVVCGHVEPGPGDVEAGPLAA